MPEHGQIIGASRSLLHGNVSKPRLLNNLHSMFSRSLEALTEDLRGPLMPTLSSLVQSHHHPHVLEIGTGSGRALLELTSRFESGQRQVCPVGTTFINYTLQQWGSGLDRQWMRGNGLGATIEEGPLRKESIAALARRYGLQVPKETPRIVDVDYYHGLPFAPHEFDLVLSGAAMKLRNRSHDFHLIGDEVLRVLKTGGSALIGMFTCSGNSIEHNRLRWLDSALLRNRTQRLLVGGTDKSVVEGLSAAMHGMVPLELVVGAAAPAAGDRCSKHYDKCARPCTRGHTSTRDAGRERAAQTSRCTMVLVLGTDCKLLFFLHVLRNSSLCSSQGSAIGPSPLSSAIESVKGQLRVESAAVRNTILSEMGARDVALNAIIKDHVKDATMKSKTLDSVPASAKASIELQVAGIRRWLRGPTWQQPVQYARSWCRAKARDGDNPVC